MTVERKYTPGPWEYHTAMNYIGFSVAPLGTLPTLAAVERCGDCMTISCFNFPGSTEANARLIAAAPELLDALETILLRIDGRFDSELLVKQGCLGSTLDDIQAYARQAIAKAKGD